MNNTNHYMAHIVICIIELLLLLLLLLLICINIKFLFWEYSKF